jgi:hypothetical protein
MMMMCAIIRWCHGRWRHNAARRRRRRRCHRHVVVELVRFDLFLAVVRHGNCGVVGNRDHCRRRGDDGRCDGTYVIVIMVHHGAADDAEDGRPFMIIFFVDESKNERRKSNIGRLPEGRWAVGTCHCALLVNVAKQK